MKTKAEPRTCNVSDNGCIAPAGYGISGVGYASGDKSCRGTCFSCGEPVCRKCSSVRKWYDYGRQRICRNCYDPEQVKREQEEAATPATLVMELSKSGLDTLWQRVQARDEQIAALFRRFGVRKFGAWDIDEKGFLKR